MAARVSTDLADLVEATGFVVPEPRSKEQIAHHYVAQAAEDRSQYLPVVPTSPGVRADDTLGTAGRKVLRMHLARMLSFEAGTRSGEDPEDLHKMRVATRRMRAAWHVFDGAYRPKVQRRYVKELRSIARALGEVRDIDVLLEGLDHYIAGLPGPGREAVEPLRAAWRRQREEARGHLLTRLDSKGYRDVRGRLPRLHRVTRCGRAADPTGPARPRARHGRLPHPHGLRTRARVRDDHHLGRHRHAACPAHRGQAAALHDGVLQRGPAGRRRASSSRRSRRCRTTLA